MIRTWLAVLLALPLLGADGGPNRPFEVTQLERIPFQPGGVIQLENSYGYLTVEGWDEPEVEITVTKSTTKAETHLDEIRVATTRRSDKEVAITTTLPARHNLISAILPSRRIVVTMPKHTHKGVTVEYTVHVPRDSRLIVHQDNGYVWVSDVTGDIEVRSHTGDMIVMLPDPGPYSINAATRLGSVSSDFTGETPHRFPLGTRFASSSQAPSRRVNLRMGRGSITIKKGPPSGPFWKD